MREVTSPVDLNLVFGDVRKASSEKVHWERDDAVPNYPLHPSCNTRVHDGLEATIEITIKSTILGNRAGGDQ